MAAYFIGFAKVKDPSKVAQYSAAALPTLTRAGGTIAGRGKLAATLAGSFQADAAIIVKFASVDAAKAWYNGADYQALIPLRDEAMSATFIVLEEPS